MSSQSAPWVTESAIVAPDQSTHNAAVADAVREGLAASPKWLPAWLFYDSEGSRLFERITVLPEYYLTRTERAIFTGYADGMIQAAFGVYAAAAGHGERKKLRLLELGAVSRYRQLEPAALATEVLAELPGGEVEELG